MRSGGIGRISRGAPISLIREMVNAKRPLPRKKDAAGLRCKFKTIGQLGAKSPRISPSRTTPTATSAPTSSLFCSVSLLASRQPIHKAGG